LIRETKIKRKNETTGQPGEYFVFPRTKTPPPGRLQEFSGRVRYRRLLDRGFPLSHKPINAFRTSEIHVYGRKHTKV